MTKQIKASLDEIVEAVHQEFYGVSATKDPIWADRLRTALEKFVVEDDYCKGNGSVVIPKSIVFVCKCGYQTSNSTDWCIHSDGCTTTKKGGEDED